MRYKSNCLPENIRRCLPTETRKELKAPTSEEAQAKINGKREKGLQDNIAALLRQRNIEAFRQRMDKRTTGVVGQPDFLFAVKGRAAAFECKLPGAKLTVEQDATLQRMEANGWLTWIIVDEQQAVNALNVLEQL